MPTAFLGLGALGHAIAGRLIATDTDLVVWNRTAARAAGAAYLECPVAGSVVPASKGALTLLAGGGESLVLRAKKQKLLERDWAPLIEPRTYGLRAVAVGPYRGSRRNPTPRNRLN